MPAPHGSIDHAEELRLQRKRGQILARMQPAEVTVEVWLSGFRHLFPGEAAERTRRNERDMLRPFRLEHGKVRVRDVTPMLAQAWALEHPAQVRPLRRAWEKAVLMRVAEWNVWRVVELPKREGERRRPPKMGELTGVVERCVDRASADPWWAHFAAMVMVAAYTGARQAGLIRLEKADVDLERDRMRLVEKGEKERVVVLPPPARTAIIEALAFRSLYCECNIVLLTDDRRCTRCGRPPYLIGRAKRPRGEGGHARVFKTKTARPLYPKLVQGAWAEVRGEFPHGFHALRHFAASWLHDLGVDEDDIAVQLGHVDAQGRPYRSLVRRVYAHPDPELALARVAEAVSR